MQVAIEVIQPDPGSSLRAFCRTEARYPAHFHRHREYELTLIRHGRGTWWVGDAVAGYTAPDLLFLGPDLPHTWQSDGPGLQEALVLQWSPELLPALGVDLPEGRAIALLVAGAGRGLHLTGTAAGALQPRVEAVLTATGYVRLLALAALLHGLSAASPRPVAQHGVASGGDPRLDAVLTWLQAECQRPIPLAEAAHRLGLGREAAARLLRRGTGASLTTLLHRFRLARACAKLAGSGESIASIALDCGFANLSHFNRLFLRHLGMPPRRWRREHGGGEVDGFPRPR